MIKASLIGVKMMRYYSHYSKWHNHQDQNYVEYMKKKFRHTFDQHLPQNKDADILEIGCANGMALLSLKELCYTNLLGIELDEELASIAKSFDLEVLNMDASKFVTETDRTFDFIYMFDVLEHFNPEVIPKFLKSIFKLLKINGKFMLVVPNATSPAGSYFRYIDWTHQVSFTPTSVSHLLEEAGFKDIIIEDERIIQEPSKEDYDNDLSYQNARKRFKKTLFHESFARWELTSMFGEDRYNLLVAPNIKIVAMKSNKSDVNVEIRLENKDILEFDKIIDWVITYQQKNQEVNIFDRLEKLEEQIRGINESIEKITEKIREDNKNIFESKLLINELNDRFDMRSEVLDVNFQSIEMKMHSTEKLLGNIRETLGNRDSVIDNEIEKLKKGQFNVYRRLNTKNNKMNKMLIRLKMARLKKIIRDSNYFDEEFYLSENHDVKNMGIDPIEHYLLYGAYEGRDPSRTFSTVEYVISHPEILRSKINPLVHKINTENQK